MAESDAHRENGTVAERVRSMFSADKRSLMVCLSALFYSLWVHFAFGSFSSIDLGGAGTMAASFNASIYSKSVAMVLAALFWRRIGRHYLDGAAVAISAALCGAGTLLAMVGGAGFGVPAGIMTGVGSAIYMFMLAHHAVFHPACIALLPYSVAVSVVLSAPLSFLPAAPLLVMAVGFALLAPITVRIASASDEEATLAAPSWEEFKPMMPLIVRALAFILVAYMAVAISDLFAKANAASPDVATQLFIALLFLGAMTISLVVRHESLGVVIYRIALFCLLFFLASIPIAGPEVVYAISDVLVMVVRGFVFLIGCRICTRARVPLLVVFGVGEAIKKVPSALLLVFFTASGVDPAASPMLEVGVQLAVAMMLVVVAIYILVFTESDVRQLFISDEPLSADTRRDLRRAQVAHKHKLTERETEVFMLLCEGRSAPRIANDLYISLATVNVHIKNIYKKCEVHSRQELLDLVILE